MLENFINKIHHINALSGLKQLPDKSINCVVYSPPYWGIRKYLKDEDANSSLELGQELTFKEYIDNLLIINKEVYRVLRDDGCLFVNIDDTHYGSTRGSGGKNSKQLTNPGSFFNGEKFKAGKELKTQCLCNIPYRFAIRMTDELGWIQRNLIIWCISQNTSLYVKNNFSNTTGQMFLKDIVRTNWKNIKLWNGEKWTNIKNIFKSNNNFGLKVLLRNGDSIIATEDHLFPTNNGLLKAKELKTGYILDNCKLPEENTVCEYIDNEMAWLIGLYLAEGSMDGNNIIQISGHVKEGDSRYERINKICKKFHCQPYSYKYNNNSYIKINSLIIKGIIDLYLGGKNAHTKFLKNISYERNNLFLSCLLDGYLEGDGNNDINNNRWRLNFCHNNKLALSLRIICNRLGYFLRLRQRYTVTGMNGKGFYYFGEIRKNKSKHFNNKNDYEIISIIKSRKQIFWDLEVEDEPNLFSTSSGILVHNCAPNKFPESCKSRFTIDFEPIFFFTKTTKYNFTQQLEPYSTKYNYNEEYTGKAIKDYESELAQNPSDSKRRILESIKNGKGRNKRAVFKVNVKPSGYKHTATFSPELITPLIQAGCPDGGVVLDPFSGISTTAITAKRLGKNFIGFELNSEYVKISRERLLENEKF